jgi:5-methylcytosine-specific restriction endonuclease McrA
MNEAGRPSGYLQPGDWKRTHARILRRDGHRCYLCDDYTRPADTVDHVVPVSQGGTHDDSNLAAAHQHPCHAAKTERERRQGLARRARKRPPRRNPNVLP